MRLDRRLVKRYRLGARYLGVLLTIGGLVTLSPLLLLLSRPDQAEHAWAFAAPATLLIVSGLALWRLASASDVDVSLYPTQAGVVVVVGWVVVLVVASWPFAAILDLGPAQALFEAVSGWTTTGLSVVDVSAAPPIVLLYRSITQLAGGAGFAIAALAVLGGPLGPGLAFAEGRTDRLTPSLRWSAITVLTIYTGYVSLGVMGLWWAGMSPFDAVNHAFAAVSTGGFSTSPESIGGYHSLRIELALLPMMLAGSTSFQIAFLLFRGRARAALRDTELRQAALLLVVVIGAIFLTLWLEGVASPSRAFRTALFEGICALTTTGFSTTSHMPWPPLGFLIVVLAMVVGGSTGSTAGGLKQIRVHLLFRALAIAVTRDLSPRRAVTLVQVHRAGRPETVTTRQVAGVVAMAVLYGLAYVALVAIMTGYGYDIASAMFETASTLGTVGLSVGVTSASAPTVVLVAQSVGMLLGRLELVVVVVAIGRVFIDGRDVWRAKRQQRRRDRKR